MPEAWSEVSREVICLQKDCESEGWLQAGYTLWSCMPGMSATALTLL